MGSFGNMLVDSPERDYYSPANREQALVLERPADQRRHADPVRQGGAGLRADGPGRQRAAGERRAGLRRCACKRGEVVRFYLTNVASSRTFNLSFGGAPIKVVASRREPVRARGAWCRAWCSRRRSATSWRCGSTGRAATRSSTRSRRSTTIRASSQPEVDTLGVVTVDAAPATPDYGDAVRHAARQRRGVARHRPLSPVLRPRAGQDAHAHGAHARAAARHRAVHERRHRVLRAGGVGGRDAGHELALHREAGALDPARRRDGQGEHGHRLAREAGLGGEAPDLQRPEVVPPDAASRSTCTASGCWSWRATACRRGTWCGRTPRSFRWARRWTC